MRLTQAFIDLSSSSIFLDQRLAAVDQIRWEGLKKFIYLASTFSSCSSNFDVFSKICTDVRILDFIFFEVTVGMGYMFMDFFIKQYTRKLDNQQKLNPLLKGITYGILMQSALWAFLHVRDLADSSRFLATSFMVHPSWVKCPKPELNITCLTATEIKINCFRGSHSTFNITPAYFHYLKSFIHKDKNVLTTRFFVSALVWIFNFFCTTVTDETLIKIFKLSFFWRMYSTLLVTLVLIIFDSSMGMAAAFTKIINMNIPSTNIATVDHVSFVYGIGFIGIYDFGTISPYIMVDNAVIVFTVLFTLHAITRSVILKMIYTALTNCVDVGQPVNPHILMFAFLPFGADFFRTHKLYVIYIYTYMIIATLGYLAMLTLTMSRLLGSEFKSVKSIYIVGVLCVIGFSFSIPISVSILSESRLEGLSYGLKATVLYLGGFKVAIVMWIYGVQRFTTDINFWLGFKPTKFWTICWSLMPIVLISIGVSRVYILSKMTDFVMSITALVWIVFSLLIVLSFIIKTVAYYIIMNKLASAFTSSSKYGPPDATDRKRRRLYNENILLRRCLHNCNIIDELFDCNHLPVAFKSRSRLRSLSSSSSLTNIYDAGTSKRRNYSDTILT